MADTITTTKGVKKRLLNHSSIANAVNTYIKSVSTMNESTAHEYLARLSYFNDFITKEYDNRISIDNLLIEIKKGNQDPYNILNVYAAYLRNHNIAALTLKQRIVTTKNFFEYCDIIYTRRSKLKVKLPRVLEKGDECFHLFQQQNVR